jgi:hypothetical protein
MSPKERIKEIQKEIVKVSIMEFPGPVMLGLGLYGKFAAEGDAFLPILNDQTVVTVLLMLGVAIMAWGVLRIISLVKESAELQAQQDMLDKLEG